VADGLRLSSEEAREIINLLGIYLRGRGVDQQAARELVLNWQARQPETLVGRGVGDLAEELVDNEIRRVYSSKENFSCELARKCRYISEQKLCDPPACLYLDSRKAPPPKWDEFLTEGSGGGAGEERPSKKSPLVKIGERIPVWIAEHHFRTVSDIERVYRYDHGVYVGDGEIVLKARIETEFPNITSEVVVRDVIGKVRRRTYIDREAFNEDHIVNLQNGLLDLETLQVRPHSPDVLTTSQLPVSYDPAATCPRIIQFWQEVSQPQDLPLLGEIAGWLLWPEYKVHVAIMLLGQGRNGKGTLLRLLTAFLGTQNVSNVTLQDLVADRFAKADLYGKLANIGGDIPSKDLSDTAPFRMLTGEDDNRAQEKYKPAFSFRNNAKLLFSANVLPRSPDDTYAFYSRWIILEFLNRFNPVEGTGDPDLLAKLTTSQELSGLLNLALEGLARLRANRWRFSYSKTVEDVELMYKRNANPVLAFLLDECEPATDSYIEKGVFFNRFKAYAERHGIRPMSVTRFGILLKDQAEIPVSDFRLWIEHGDRPRCWLGVRFADRATECQSTPSIVLPTPILGSEGEEEERGGREDRDKQNYGRYGQNGMDCTPPPGEDPGQREDSGPGKPPRPSPAPSLQAEFQQAEERARAKEEQFKTPAPGQQDEYLAALVRFRTSYKTTRPDPSDPFRFVEEQLQPGDEILVDYERALRWAARGLVDVIEIILPYEPAEDAIKIAAETPEESPARVDGYTARFAATPAILTAEEA
jgi:P4 family phage/plasmid primase-like protien